MTNLELVEAEAATYTALEGLGATLQEVVARLARLNVKGAPDSLCRCPIARYLGRLSSGIWSQSLGSLKVPSGGGPWSVDCRTATYGPLEVRLPPQVRAFVAGFDLGRYPNLLED